MPDSFKSPLYSSFQFTRPVGGATFTVTFSVNAAVFQFTRPVGGAT